MKGEMGKKGTRSLMGKKNRNKEMVVDGKGEGEEEIRKKGRQIEKKGKRNG